MKLSRSYFLKFAVLSCAAIFSGNALAASRLVGGVGYESLKIRHDNDDLQGWHFAGLVQGETITFTKGLDLTVGAGVGYSKLDYSMGLAESLLTQPQLKLEAGLTVDLKVATIQGMAGLDYGFFGTNKIKLFSQGVLISEKNHDVNAFMRINFLGRVMVNVIPLLKVGIEITTFAGSIRTAEIDTTNITGYTASVVASTVF